MGFFKAAPPALRGQDEIAPGSNWMEAPGCVLRVHPLTGQPAPRGPPEEPEVVARWKLLGWPAVATATLIGQAIKKDWGMTILDMYPIVTHITHQPYLESINSLDCCCDEERDADNENSST